MLNADGRRSSRGLIAAVTCLVVAGAVLLMANPVRSETALLRTTLIVSDIDASISWYRQLGFEVAETLGGPRSPQSAFPLAGRASGFRLVILAGSNGKGGRIGLLEFADAAPPVVVAGSGPVGVGNHVLVVEVSDARAIFAALRDQGEQPLTDEPTVLSRMSADGRPAIGYVFHIYDPDGTLVEIMQLPLPIE